jgi:hypothetical protein
MCLEKKNNAHFKENTPVSTLTLISSFGIQASKQAPNEENL